MATYSNYSNVDSETTYLSMLLEKYGTGLTVGTFRAEASADMLVKLTGTARWYSDAAGTLDESTEFTFPAGVPTTRYLKINGTSAYMLLNPLLLINFGSTGQNGWISPLNSMRLNIDISKFSNIVLFNVASQCEVVGSITNLSNLNWLSDVASSVIGMSGDIAGKYFTRIRVTSVNTITGDLSNQTNLTLLQVTGSNTLYGDLGVNNVVNGIATNCVLDPCAIVAYTAGATWSNATIKINPSVGYGLDATEVDNMLIDMAASPTLSSKVITLMGSNAPRTSASDAAVLTLQGRGCTVNTNP